MPRGPERLKLSDLTGGGLEAAETLLEAELENYTPLIAGGWQASVWACHKVHGRHPLALSLSKQLVGRARWLLRVLIATGYGARSHREAEEWPGIELEPDKKLGLVQLAFGSTSPAWKALYKLSLTMKDPTGCKQDRELEKLGDQALSRYGLLVRDKNEYLKSLKKDAKTPIEPGCRFKLSVSRRSLPRDVEEKLEKAVDLGFLDALVAGLALAVPRVLGLGQGATRGYGRFILETTGNSSYRLSPASSDLENKLEGVLNAFRDLDSASSKNNAVNAVKGVFEELLNLLNNAVKGSRVQQISALPRDIPILMVDRIEVVEVNRNHVTRLAQKKSIASMRSDTMEFIIEAIGFAVTKASWKTLKFKKPMRPGAAFHTWILGLPRAQPQGVQASKCRGELKVGYLIRKRALKELSLDRIVEGSSITYSRMRGAGNQEEDFIGEAVSEHVSLKQAAISADKDEEEFITSRRVSPLILFPVNKNSKLHGLVALVPFSARDLEYLADGGALYHAGGFARLIKGKKGKIEFAKAARLVQVHYVKTHGVGKKQYYCKNNNNYYVNRGGKGVMTPPCIPTNIDYYSAAIEFVKRVLEGGGCT